MNTPLIFLAAGLGLGAIAGYVLTPSTSHDTSSSNSPAEGSCPDGSPPAYWVAPMDASYRRDGPGKSPMGMDLVPFCENQSEAMVSISPQVVQNLGIRTAEVRRGTLASQIRAVGELTWNQEKLTMVHTRAEGWIEQLGVASVGDRLRQGDLVYSIYSPKLFAAESEFLAAGGNRVLRDAAANRLRSLGYDDQQLKALAKRGQAAPQTELRSPGDLSVVALSVRSGQFVTPGTMLMTLGDLSSIWLVAQVAERDASLIYEGQTVEASIEAYPGRSWSGRVETIYPELDHATRTLRVQLVFDNPDRMLKPNMFASVNFETAQSETILAPRAAIIRRGDGDRAVIARAQGDFDIAAVQIGKSNEADIEILEGLKPGDRVVISGQFLLDSEANVSAESLRLSQASLPAGMATGTIMQIDPEAGEMTLKHGAFSPVGDDGFSMPGMTMPFALHEHIDPRAWTVGDRVGVVVERTRDGQYRIRELTAATHEHDAAAADEAPNMETMIASPPTAHQHDSPPEIPLPGMTKATIVQVHEEHRALTLQHEYIESLGMPAMTMSFEVADDVDLRTLREGDAVEFMADISPEGSYRVTHVVPSP